MTKKDATEWLRKKGAEGYITYNMLLDVLYREDQDVPEEFLKMCIHKPEPRDGTITIHCGRELYPKLKEFFGI